MKSDYYKKIEKYLYRLYEPEVLVQEVRDYYIARMNLSTTAWLKKSNSMENQIVKMMDSKQLNEIQKWVDFLKSLLTFFKNEKPEFYDFINFKYIEKRHNADIKKKMNINSELLKKLRGEVIKCIYIKAMEKGLIEENERRD